MLKTHFHPVFQVSMALRKSLFQDEMSKSALLETLILDNRARVGKNEGSFLPTLSGDLTKVGNYPVEKLKKWISVTLTVFIVQK